MIPELNNKDRRVQELVGFLIQKYQINNFKIKDYWDSDHCAIGLMDRTERYLIYISVIDLENTGYYVALENPANLNSNLPYIPAGEIKNLKLTELETLFVNHLKIEGI